ncbi:MAG: hypothetical protein ACRD12_13470 [Acidimicrobiales bacterium]
MNAPASSRRLVPALAAAAGVVVAHVIDYAVLFPRAEARDAYLHATGHGYWPVAIALASGAAAVAVLLVAGSAALHAARGSLAPTPGRWARFGSLAAWQTAAFVAMEIGERGLAGIGPAALVRSPELWLGLVLQAPVAWLVVKVLGRADRVGAAVGARFHRPSVRPRRPVLLPAAFAVPPSLRLASPAWPRGPPPLPLRV